MTTPVMFELETMLGTGEAYANNDVITFAELDSVTTEAWLTATDLSASNSSAYIFSNDTWNSTVRTGELTSPKHSYLKCTEFLFYFNGILILSLCVLGMIGNTVSILVLQRDRNNQVAAFLLQALAITDNAVLAISFIVLGIIWGVMPYFHKTKLLANVALPYVIKYLHPLGYMTQTCAVWMTVLLAVNRYIAICRPFDAPRLCTLTKAKIQVATVFIFSFLFNFPRFFQYRIDGKAVPTSIGEQTLFGIVYTNALNTVLVLLLPLVLLIVLNTKLILELQSMDRRRSSISSNMNGQDDNISFIMVIIIVIFVICNTPDRITQILRNNAGNIVRRSSKCGIVFYFINVSNFLIISNSSTNFLIYYFFRARFRQILKRKFCNWYTSNMYRAGSASEVSGMQVSMKTVVARSIIRRPTTDTLLIKSNGSDHNTSPKNTSLENGQSDSLLSGKDSKDNYIETNGKAHVTQCL